MKRIFIFAALIFAVNFCGAATNDFFEKGLVAANAGNFSDAAVDFEKSVQRKPSSGALLNLGIAEWQRGHAGAAILAWERAQWIDPFDSRATQNLKFARAVAELDAPESKWFEIASTWLPADAWVWLAGASLWLAAGALVLPRVFRWKRSGWQQTLAALGFSIFIFSMTANFGVVSRTQIGFVVKKDAPLLLTPTREGEVIATLTGGEAARKLRTRGNYLLVRTSSALGWIAQEDFGLVSSP